MWILVLTLIATSSNGGMSVAGVPGFLSEASCKAAADAWLKQNQGSGWSNKTALCAKA